ERVQVLRALVGIDVQEEMGAEVVLDISSEALRSCRSTVLTLGIAHGKTASSRPRSRAASKTFGATRSAKYGSRNEKVWSVKWPPGRNTNALIPQSSGTTPL